MHGCRSGRAQAALDEIYVARLCRKHPDGVLKNYTTFTLGAIGSDLAAVSWFFTEPFKTIASALSTPAQGYVISEAAFALLAQGRLPEAVSAMQAALEMAKTLKEWRNAAVGAAQLSEMQLQLGDIDAAVQAAAASVEFADRSGDPFEQWSKRTVYAGVLFNKGQLKEAGEYFENARKRQRRSEPHLPPVYSVWGYRYFDYLLSKREWRLAIEGGNLAYNAATERNLSFDAAISGLSLARACLGLSLSTREANCAANGSSGVDFVRDRLSHAIEGVLASGQLNYLLRCYLSSASFRRGIGDWKNTFRDLDEVLEIAEPGPMRLYLCDMALEHARLAFAKIEAFAPLNGMLEEGQNPPKPVVPGEEDIAELKAEAEKQIKIADDYIQSCGYHRRDEELAELQAVLRGEKTFASLPPRV